MSMLHGSDPVHDRDGQPQGGVRQDRDLPPALRARSRRWAIGSSWSTWTPRRASPRASSGPRRPRPSRRKDDRRPLRRRLRPGPGRSSSSRPRARGSRSFPGPTRLDASTPPSPTEAGSLQTSPPGLPKEVRRPVRRRAHRLPAEPPPLQLERPARRRLRDGAGPGRGLRGPGHHRTSSGPSTWPSRSTTRSFGCSATS